MKNIVSIKKVAIVGVGLMGGSLALSIRDKFPRVEVWGYARSNASYQRLKRLRAVRHLDKNLERVISGSDIIVLGLPIYSIVEYFKKITPYLKPGAIVMDLGSTKAFIETMARKTLPKDTYFVGCHPLCGSEKSGASSSSKDLYKGALCIITSSSKNKATQTVAGLWKALGAKVVFIAPRTHDKILSSVSHLPHLISFSLTSLIPVKYLMFAPKSLKDLTRISGSSAELWRDIFLSNRENIVRSATRFINILKKTQRLLRDKDSVGLFNFIKKVNARHDLFRQHTSCPLAPHVEFRRRA